MLCAIYFSNLDIYKLLLMHMHVDLTKQSMIIIKLQVANQYYNLVKGSDYDL